MRKGVKGTHVHQGIYDEANHWLTRDVWTPERWENFRTRLHRQGLLQRKPQVGWSRSSIKRKARVKGSSEESNYDIALGEGRLPKYEAQTICRYRKQVGKRHARRKVARASRKRNRG